MPDELVSIVIPAYNPASYLMEAIASAAAQTHPNLEIVLVNDGTDREESLAVLAQASRLVSTYVEQPNRGVAA
ncbi:MAG: glycosyltransferase, partial [Bryobacteraceae bacterium]